MGETAWERQSDGGEGQLIPLDVDGRRIYMRLQQVDGFADDEQDISGRARRRLDEALEGLTNTARAVVTRLRETDASRVKIQFGCEFALESGSVVAVVGKARTSSAFTVELEWERSPEQ